MYDEAIVLMDISGEKGVFLGDYSEKTFEVLDLIGSREKTIEVCKYRFRTVARKQPYYDKLRERCYPRKNGMLSLTMPF